MRVTAEVKSNTRERLLRVARKLFASRGYTKTTTRDIAAKSGVAPGTPFNYFRSKEALATALFAEAIAPKREEFLAARRPRATLAEELFAHALCELKALEPYRSYCAEVFARSLSPFATDAVDGDELRRAHLEAVGRLLALHRVDPDPATLQLYWTLHLGVLAAWARPAAGGEAETRDDDVLALLDRTVRLFVTAVAPQERMEERTQERSR
jgi:AcrR family transcriptional regulator